MLGRPRTGEAQTDLDQALALLSGLFSGARYEALEPPYLFLADTLLDLYGEDLRARAFLFSDPARDNELCLRPDFTGPVALAHSARGWETPAAYAYQGPVFRSQPQGQGRPVEYWQAGIERFGDTDHAAADAQVFVLLHRGLAALGIGRPAVTIGDLSIPFALLDALDMPARLRARLKRHFWRPHRFQALLTRAEHPPEPGASRRAVLEAAGDADRMAELMAAEGEPLGLRSAEELADRAREMAAEESEQRLDPAISRLIARTLDLECPAREATERLAEITDGTDLADALARFDARLDAIEGAGIPLDDLGFDAGFGRNLEYYDGFVFEMRARDRAAHPPLSGGGRYDAMTRRLGAERAIPAVGGMIRPEAVLGVRP